MLCNRYASLGKKVSTKIFLSPAENFTAKTYETNTQELFQ